MYFSNPEQQELFTQAYQSMLEGEEEANVLKAEECYLRGLGYARKAIALVPNAGAYGRAGRVAYTIYVFYKQKLKHETRKAEKMLANSLLFAKNALDLDPLNFDGCFTNYVYELQNLQFYGFPFYYFAKRRCLTNLANLLLSYAKYSSNMGATELYLATEDLLRMAYITKEHNQGIDVIPIYNAIIQNDPEYIKLIKQTEALLAGLA
jgi:hypothetical protein